jgi:serine/threonine protein kinase
MPCIASNASAVLSNLCSKRASSIGIQYNYPSDLKPENIVIQQQHLKVTDFGFAKALSSSRQLTRTVIGTPLYMSPQILSKQPYSSKCDIWSIGVIYYEILIGHHPWVAKSMNSLYRTIANSPNVSFPS